VISGILAGGIPGFRMVLCCFTLVVFEFICCFANHTEMIQGYHLLHQLTHFTYELDLSRTVSLVWVFVWFGCVLVCFVCFWCSDFVSFCALVMTL